MRRATKQDVAALRHELQDWREPLEVRAILEDVRKQFGFYAASQGALQLWREAYRATQFAPHVGADAIRLGEDPPDFYLRRRGEQIPVELAEVKSAFDLRDWDWDEHAELANAGKPLPIEQYDPTSECLEMSERILAAVTRKVVKNYPEAFVLAVTANTFWFDSLEETMVRGIERAAAVARGRFRAVWILAGGRFFEFSEEGIASLPITRG